MTERLFGEKVNMSEGMDGTFQYYFTVKLHQYGRINEINDPLPDRRVEYHSVTH